MGLAIAIALEDGHRVNHVLGDEGKTLLTRGERLDALAEEQGSRPLHSFWHHGEVELPADFDGDPDWLAELVEEAGLPTRWFDPTEGLAALDELRAGLDRATEATIVAALDALRAALVIAKQRGTRFHLTYVH